MINRNYYKFKATNIWIGLTGTNYHLIWSSYERSKSYTYHQLEKHLIHLLTPEQKIIKDIPVIIKQFKNIINTNNSFLRARTYYVKQTYLQKRNVSHCHIATTSKHKSYGMNLVVTKHKLTFL